MKYFPILLLGFFGLFVFYLFSKSSEKEGLTPVYNGPNGPFTISKCGVDTISKLVTTPSDTLSDYDRMKFIQQITINNDPNFSPIINNTPPTGENYPGVPSLTPAQQLVELKKLLDMYKEQESQAIVDASMPKTRSLADLVKTPPKS
jgi:hypothetical protein